MNSSVWAGQGSNEKKNELRLTDAYLVLSYLIATVNGCILRFIYLLFMYVNICFGLFTVYLYHYLKFTLIQIDNT